MPESEKPATAVESAPKIENAAQTRVGRYQQQRDQLRQELAHYSGPRSGDELAVAERRTRQSYTQTIEDLDPPAGTKTQLGQKMEEEIARTQALMSRFHEQQREARIVGAQALFESVGGDVDSEAKPYKQFDPKKYERFLIQKGKLGEADVVFKVGETANQKMILEESRNLQAIEHAPVESGQKLDVHFVRQVGEVFKDTDMVGLATEYLQDNPELKKSLSPTQKAGIVGQVIENLQRVRVTEQALNSGMPVHDGEKIVGDAQRILGQLLQEGQLDQESAESLQAQFRDALPALSKEKAHFVHGDVHGDNIFVQKRSDGALDVSLLDFESLRISNQYHDWSETLNKSSFLKHLQRERPDLFEPIRQNAERMWLDDSVQFDEQKIVGELTGGDPVKEQNFRLTRTYDMLMRIWDGRKSTSPLQQERAKLYLNQLRHLARPEGKSNLESPS